MKCQMALTLMVPIALAGCAAGSVAGVANSATAAKSGDRSQAGESSQRSGQLLVTKDCRNYTGLAGQQCNITQSSLPALAFATITYKTAADADHNLDTDIVIDPPGNGANVAFGHCRLSLNTGIGACEVNGGRGTFTQFHAQVAVAVAPAGLPFFTWTGTYSYGK